MPKSGIRSFKTAISKTCNSGAYFSTNPHTVPNLRVATQDGMWRKPTLRFGLSAEASNDFLATGSRWHSESHHGGSGLALMIMSRLSFRCCSSAARPYRCGRTLWLFRGMLGGLELQHCGTGSNRCHIPGKQGFMSCPAEMAYCRKEIVKNQYLLPFGRFE